MFDFAPGSGAAAAAHEQWQATIRELPASQLYHLQWHLLRLETDCRRSRLGNPASDVFLAEYAARIDAANTLVLGCFVNGQMRGAAVLRSLQAGWYLEAEAAFSVEGPWQGRGIGTALMAEIVRAARERRIDHVYVSCHALNRRMQVIAERFAARIDFEECEYFADITVRRELAAPEIAGRDGKGEPPDGMDGMIVLDL